MHVHVLLLSLLLLSQPAGSLEFERWYADNSCTKANAADAESDWASYRSTNSQPAFGGSWPTQNGTTTVTESGAYILLANDTHVVMFRDIDEVTDPGVMVGFAHRAWGEEMITAPSTAAFKTWEVCRGDPTVAAGEFGCASGTRVDGDGITGTRALIEHEGYTTLRFTRSGSDITATEYYQLTRRGLRMRAVFEHTGAGSGIVAATFPAIAGFGLANGRDYNWIEPKGSSGWIYSAARGEFSGTSIQGRYGNGFSMAWPFFGWTVDGMSLLWWVDAWNAASMWHVSDPDNAAGNENYSASVFFSSAVATGNTLETAWVHIENFCGEPESVLTRFRDVAETYATGYWDARRLSAQTHIPVAVRDSVFWALVDVGTAGDETNFTAEVSDHRTNVSHPISVHGYNLHTPGFDIGYPDMVAKSWAATEIGTIEGGGEVAMPYSNFDYADLSDATPDSVTPTACHGAGDPNHAEGHWSTLGSSAITNPSYYATLDPTTFEGNYLWFLPSSGSCLAEMNPADATWLSRLAAQVDVIETISNTGIYLDTCCNGFFGGNSIRPVGDLSEEKAKFDSITSGHSFAPVLVEHGTVWAMRWTDAWSNFQDDRLGRGFVGGFLTAGHKIITGPRGLQGDSYEAFAIKVSDGMLWGHQPGNMSDAQVDGDAETAARHAMIEEVLDARLSLKDWFSYGDFIGEFREDPGASNPTITAATWCVNQSCSTTEPNVVRSAIYATVWRSEAGEYRVPFCNRDDALRTADYLIPGNVKGRPVLYEHDGTLVADAARSGDVVSLTAPSQTCRYMRFE